jgi:hypothetical protein
LRFAAPWVNYKGFRTWCARPIFCRVFQPGFVVIGKAYHHQVPDSF